MLTCSSIIFELDIYAKKHKVMWEDETIKFSDVPYVVLSFKTLDCHHGVDKNTTVKKRYKENKEKKRVSETKDLLRYSSNYYHWELVIELKTLT